jgi:hypothetical protein
MAEQKAKRTVVDGSENASKMPKERVKKIELARKNPKDEKAEVVRLPPPPEISQEAKKRSQKSRLKNPDVRHHQLRMSIKEQREEIARNPPVDAVVKNRSNYPKKCKAKKKM